MALSDTEMAAWRGLLQTHRALITKLDAELVESHDLPLVWYDALVQLNEAGGPLRMHEFAQRLLLSRSATTRFVDRLEDDGLVMRRMATDDRRGMEVELTDSGFRRLQEAAPAHLAGVQEHFADHLDDDQARALAAAFTTLLEGNR